MMRALTAMAATLLALAYPASAFADPAFVFEVPVRIENAPPLANNTVTINCTVKYTPAGERFYTDGGSGETAITVGPAGTFRGVARVEVSLSPGVARADISQYACTIRRIDMTNAATHAVETWRPNGVTNVPYQTATGQRVRSIAILSQGPIPR